MANHSWQQINSYWSAHNDNPYSPYHRTSFEEAIIIAKERVPGEVATVELDTENGLFVYEIQIKGKQGIKYELEIDVYTGQIVKLKVY